MLATAMLATTALASSCCLVPGARASWRARLLAVVMSAVMVAVMLRAPAGGRAAGAVVLLVVAVVVVREVPDDDTAALHVAWHRAAGAILMAAAAVLMPDHGAVGHAVAGHGAHDGEPSGLALLGAAAIAYVSWSLAVALGRGVHGALPGVLARVEHAGMGASLALMVLAMA
jgi:hypothetical protein